MAPPTGWAEHTSCWGWPPCGGCDSCLAAQASYYASLRTPEPASWDVHGATGVLLCWGKEPAHALALAFDLGGTAAPSAGPLT